MSLFQLICVLGIIGLLLGLIEYLIILNRREREAAKQGKQHQHRGPVPPIHANCRCIITLDDKSEDKSEL